MGDDDGGRGRVTGYWVAVGRERDAHIRCPPNGSMVDEASGTRWIDPILLPGGEAEIEGNGGLLRE